MVPSLCANGHIEEFSICLLCLLFEKALAGRECQELQDSTTSPEEHSTICTDQINTLLLIQQGAQTKNEAELEALRNQNLQLKQRVESLECSTFTELLKAYQQKNDELLQVTRERTEIVMQLRTLNEQLEEEVHGLRDELESLVKERK
ncbi:hypothetical protein D9757_009900 [Collybiopsis confluens]|uniref:Uncharacterized protein n=1 Tax=Collybiopsis confluens TaxID=2823264 RepID=A0A8H5GWQ9_9AGAR|nr:hypothetical protein D9757_009900 [Collybiopsis confluens]